MYSHRREIVHLLAIFRSNLSIGGRVMTSYPFFIHFLKWRPAAILDLIWVMLDHPRSSIVGLSFVLKFGLYLIYSFGDIAIHTFILYRFGLKLPTRPFLGVLRAYFPKYGHPSF